MSPKPPSREELFHQELFEHATRLEYFLFKYRRWLALASFVTALVLTLVIGLSLKMGDALGEARESGSLQEAHAIGLAMYSYANDHDGNYPTGKSSTEVFQQLLDQGYVTDPAIFFLSHTPGKIKGTSKTLKPENICWDVTDGARTDDSPELPLVFSTGCKIDYVPNAKAYPLVSAPFGDAGVVVFYVSNSAQFVFRHPDGVTVIDPTFDSKRKTYHQLTPDGTLPR